MARIAPDPFMKDWFLDTVRIEPFELGTHSRRRRKPSPDRGENANWLGENGGTDYARKYREEETTTCLDVCLFTMIT